MRLKNVVLRPAALVCAVLLGVPASAQEPVEIKFWTLTNPGQGDFYAEAIKAFESENPGIQITHEEFPNESYKTAIQVALNGSEPPDAFFNWVGEDSARLRERRGSAAGRRQKPRRSHVPWLPSARRRAKHQGARDRAAAIQ
jgi:ABC-type glycerol-3-phosphate transport system substrate-binding protein